METDMKQNNEVLNADSALLYCSADLLAMQFSHMNNIINPKNLKISVLISQTRLNLIHSITLDSVKSEYSRNKLLAYYRTSLYRVLSNEFVFCNLAYCSPVIGVHHMCQQTQSEDPAGGLPQPSAPQLPLQLGVSLTQAEASQHTHPCITLQPETLNLHKVDH